MDLKKKRESFEKKRGRENEFNARQNLSSSLLTVFSTAVKDHVFTDKMWLLVYRILARFVTGEKGIYNAR